MAARSMVNMPPVACLKIISLTPVGDG